MPIEKKTFTFKDNATTTMAISNVKRIYQTNGDVLEMLIEKNDLGEAQLIQLFYKDPTHASMDLSEMLALVRAYALEKIKSKPVPQR